MAQPFFTIGIPTYNRHDMLQEALHAVIAQSFTDFEVIVGNDYTAEVLTGAILGIDDPRIRIVNHPRNLREVGNMNALLDLAAGRYFTWLFDDDLYEPDFLQTAHDYLLQADFPPVLFTAFRMLKPGTTFQPRRPSVVAATRYTGQAFLEWYADRQPQVASTYGLFDTVSLRGVVGGVEALCPAAIGFHCEYLLLVKCALLEPIVYLDAPYYVYRRHADSASESNQDLENYRVAGQELLRRCSDVLKHPSLTPVYSATLLKIARIHVITFAYVAARFESARGGSFVAKLGCTLSRHWRELARTRGLYASLGGSGGLRTGFAFLQGMLYCWYVMVRLLAHFACRRPREGNNR